MSNRSSSFAVAIMLLLAMLVVACAPISNLAGRAPGTDGGEQAALDAVGRPMTFVPNVGQWEEEALFRTVGSTGMLVFARNEVLLPLPSLGQTAGVFDKLVKSAQADRAEPTEPPTLRLRFVGANPKARAVAQKQLPGIVNYYLGNEPAHWHSGISTYASLTYEQLYPGIDLVYEGGEGLLKGTYLVAPGAEPSAIRWRYEGASGVALDEGELLITVAGVEEAAPLVERRPLAWQTVDGERVPVRVRYARHADDTLGFSLGRYDTSRPLLIDPTLDYSTYWGGAGCEGAYQVALDSSKKVYVAGTSNSPNAHPDCEDHGNFDLYITKLDPVQTGASQLVYTTYIGGSDFDIAIGVGVDGSGNAYVAGYSWSGNFPTTANAYQKTAGGGFSDGVVVRLNAAGAVQYATYLGGNDFEEQMSMALGSNGLVYVTGFTDSANFPTTGNAYQSSKQSRAAFVSVLDTSKSGNASLVYSTYFGASGFDEGYGITASGGIIYFAGTTTSTDLPLKNPIFNTNGGGSGYGDAYVVKLDPSQSGNNQLLFATYLGGSDDELPGGVAVDGSGDILVVGSTGSSGFITTTISPAFGGGDSDAFLVKMHPGSPSSLLFSRFVGGSGNDGIRHVVLDASGNAYVGGATGSANLPTVDPIDNTFGGGVAPELEFNWLGPGDGLVAAFDATGAMTFGSYLGGNAAETVWGLTLDGAGNVYAVGGTRSTDLPAVHALQGSNAGFYDAFITRIGGVAGTPGPTNTPEPTATLTPTVTNTPVVSIYLPVLLRNH